MTGLKIHQIYYRRNQRRHLDSGFSAWNNLKNRRPEWAELWVMIRALESNPGSFKDLTGFVSWKFRQKTCLTSCEVRDFIEAHPGYDCYIFNPLTLQTALFASVWDQGERWHPGIKTHAARLLEECGINADLDSCVDTFDNTSYCNYFVGGPRFWAAYFAVTKKVFDTLEDQRRRKTGPWRTTIHNSRKYKFIPFIVERFFGIVARLNPELKILPYRYPEDKQSIRTPGFEELIARADRYKALCRDNRNNSHFANYLEIQREMLELLKHCPRPDKLLLG